MTALQLQWRSLTGKLLGVAESTHKHICLYKYLIAPKVVSNWCKRCATSVKLLSAVVSGGGEVGSYQLNTSKAANPQRVDDIEVSQLETGEKGILSLVPENRTDGDAFAEYRTRELTGLVPQAETPNLPGLNSNIAPDSELYLQHLTTWKKGNFLDVWMEKEVMGKEEDGGAGRLLIFLLCCLHWTESKSLISRLKSNPQL